MRADRTIYRLLWFVLLVLSLREATAQQRTIGVQPVPVAQYYWDTGANGFLPCPSDLTTSPSPRPPAPTALYGWNASINWWTPFTACSTQESFSQISSGLNTTASMIVGSGASLETAGTGSILATALTGTPEISVSNVTDTSLTNGFCVQAGAGGLLTTVGVPCNAPQSFSTLTGGTNLGAALVIGSGASLSTTGSGTIAATSLPYSGLTGTIPTWNQNTTGTAAGLTGNPAISVSSLTDIGLTAGNCVQASTGGQLTTTGFPCGSGSGGATLPSNAMVFGLSPTTSRAVTPTDISTLLGYTPQPQLKVFYADNYTSLVGTPACTIGGVTYTTNLTCAYGAALNYVSPSTTGAAVVLGYGTYLTDISLMQPCITAGGPAARNSISFLGISPQVSTIFPATGATFTNPGIYRQACGNNLNYAAIMNLYIDGNYQMPGIIQEENLSLSQFEHIIGAHSATATYGIDFSSINPGSISGNVIRDVNYIGTAGHTGAGADIYIPVVTGSLSTPVIGNSVQSVAITAEGTGGTAGTYNATTTSCSTSIPGVAIDPIIPFTVSGGGISSVGTITNFNHGLFCPSSITLTIPSGATLTGATLAATMGPNGAGYGAGSGKTPTLQIYGHGNPANTDMPCTGTAPAGTVGFTGGILSSVTLTQASTGCVGPVFGYIYVGDDVQYGIGLGAIDVQEEMIQSAAGWGAAILFNGGGTVANHLHPADVPTLIEMDAYGWLNNTELDSPASQGIRVTNGTAYLFGTNYVSDGKYAGEGSVEYNFATIPGGTHAGGNPIVMGGGAGSSPYASNTFQQAISETGPIILTAGSTAGANALPGMIFGDNPPTGGQPQIFNRQVAISPDSSTLPALSIGSGANVPNFWTMSGARQFAEFSGTYGIWGVGGGRTNCFGFGTAGGSITLTACSDASGNFGVGSNSVPTSDSFLVSSAGVVTGSRYVSSVATGTAPLSVASTTQVANLNVSAIGGVSISGTPSTGQVPVATSATTATWQTPSSSGNTVSTALTSGILPLSNGANSIVNSLFSDSGTAGAYGGTGGFSAASLISTGSTNGALSVTFQSSAAAAPGANTFQISPAVAITTPWSWSPAAAPASGYVKGTNTSGIVQESFESAINLASSDVTGLLPASKVATATSGAAIPLLNGTNAWSGAQSFSAGISTNKLNQPAASTFATALAISSSTTGSFTFPVAYTSAPVCAVSPRSALGATTYGYTVSTTAVAVTLSVSGSETFDIVCVGNPN